MEEEVSLKRQPYTLTCFWMYTFARKHNKCVRLVCVRRKPSYVQLCAELQGSVPCPAPQTAAVAAGLQTGRQGLVDLSSVSGSQRGLSAAPTAQPGPCGDLWRRHRRDIRSLPPGKAGLDRHSASGAGQVGLFQYRLNLQQCCTFLH